ncbi:4-aminobutyrate transaminase, partial [Pseudomonas syringae pv. syringae]
EQHGIVLIADEIQSGFGRTGKWFGFEHSGIQPDLVTVAKSLAGGMPLSGVVGRAEIMDAPLPGGLGGT